MGTAELQGDLWGAHAGDWADLHEAAFAPLYATVLKACGVGPGKRLLDVGCGAGLALMTAYALGATGAGIDAAEALIDIAQRRLPDAVLLVGEQEEIPFVEDSFDITTGFNSFQYAASPVRALEEARRVTRAGGAVAAAVWGDPADCDMSGYIAALGGLLPAPPLGAPGPWALSPPGALEALMEQAGLAIGETDSIDLPFAFGSEAAALTALLAAGPAERAVRHAGREAVATAVLDAIAPFRDAAGAYLLTNRFRYVIATA